MFSTVTSWLGGTKPDYEVATDDAKKETADVKDKGQETTENEKEDVKSRETDEKGKDAGPHMPNIGEVGEKTLTAAKEWGGYLLNVGKAATAAATEQVVKTAKQVKETVEEKTILGDFSKEQEKFVSEKKEKKRAAEAGVAPWVGYNEEESMKSQILALSQDKRNFLRNPPSGVQFHYDAAASHPVAMAMLVEDPNLKKIRFELVPTQVKEEVFWRNYFYRVSLIKQSAQLTSLAQQSGDEAETQERKQSIDKDSKKSTTNKKDDEKELVLPSSSPPDNEFISDAFSEDHINEEDLRAEMKQFGLAEEKKDTTKADEDIPEWEKELDAELQEYEVVDDGNNMMDDADLENEILQQIEAEANGPK